jgi:opacity protein-like surface antigen
MKRLLVVLTLVGCMIVSLSAAAMASNVYVEGFGAGKWDSELSSKDGDLDLGFAVGGEYNFDKFKVGLEYLSGTEENGKPTGGDQDYRTYEIKAGYRVFQNDQFNLDATLGYYNEKYKDVDRKIKGAILGADASYKINDKFALSGSVGFSVDGDIDAPGLYYDGNDADILIGKIQGSYNFTDQIAGFLGYRYVSSDIDQSGKIKNHGATLGVSYNF